MLTTQPITKNFKDFHMIQALYRSAFPRQEQAPMMFLLRQTKREEITFNAYYDEGTFVGFTYTITFDNLTYLAYLAVRSDIRSKGYGAQIMQHLRESYPNNRIVLCLEVQDETAVNSAQRERRRAFYHKNGYDSAGFSCVQHGNHLDVFINKGRVTPEEFRALFKQYLGAVLFVFFKPKIHRGETC